MDKNKYLDIIYKYCSECARELINLFVSRDMDSLNITGDDVYIRIINDDFGDVEEVKLVSITLKRATDGKPYLLLNGTNVDGVASSAYIDEDGGDYYDVAHSLPKIYSAVIVQLGLDE